MCLHLIVSEGVNSSTIWVGRLRCWTAWSCWWATTAIWVWWWATWSCCGSTAIRVRWAALSWWSCWSSSWNCRLLICYFSCCSFLCCLLLSQNFLLSRCFLFLFIFNSLLNLICNLLFSSCNTTINCCLRSLWLMALTLNALVWAIREVLMRTLMN